MSQTTSEIAVNVDVTNPGQFFACCGLLELADRIWPGAEGRFDRGMFHIVCLGTLADLLSTLAMVELTQLDPEDNTSTPVFLGQPFQLRLDWWLDHRSGGRELKVWAGTMESYRIARAMQAAVKEIMPYDENILNVGRIAYDPDNAAKKVEPYYFDARRGPNAHSRDVGFSANDLSLTTTASPAVELLCLIGLQRVLPQRTSQPRIFEYCVWKQWLPITLIPPAVHGRLPSVCSRVYRFENWYRTGQRKHKAFLPAIPIA